MLDNLVKIDTYLSEFYTVYIVDTEKWYFTDDNGIGITINYKECLEFIDSNIYINNLNIETIIKDRFEGIVFDYIFIGLDPESIIVYKAPNGVDSYYKSLKRINDKITIEPLCNWFIKNLLE